MTRHFYSGRAIFHHQEKTAGQAVTAWLERHLGEGTVTPSLIGDHRSLIRQYGGEYPVISGHLYFDGSGLDPRYSYFTVFREPADRLLSWLFYVDRDVEEIDNTRLLKAGARLFLETEGDQTNDVFMETALNLYVKVFSRVAMVCEPSDAHKLRVALEVAQTYALVGFYEKLPDFVDALAAFFYVNEYTALPVVNVTARRMAMDEVSGKLRDKILKLTELDRNFYARMLEWAGRKTDKKARCRAAKHLAVTPYTREFQRWPVDHRLSTRASTYLEVRAPATLPSQNGVVSGGSVTSNGEPGYLSFGSRIELGAGVFQVVAVGYFETTGAICMAEVRCNAGQSLLAKKCVTGPLANPAPFAASLSFALDDKRDVEFRFATPAQHRVRLDTMYVLSSDALDMQFKRAGERLLAEAGKPRNDAALTVVKATQLQSVVGVFVGTTLQTYGAPGGWLCFGPYMQLSRGCWQFALVGTVGPFGLGGAHVNICCQTGQQILQEQPLSITPFNEESDFIGQPWTFTLEQDVKDLEIRLWVSRQSQINLAGVILLRLDDEFHADEGSSAISRAQAARNYGDLN